MDAFNTTEILGKIGLYFPPFLFALCFHEYAHGWVAKRKGDNTAEMMGRLTMNPFAHADPIGTFLLPLMGVIVGWSFMFGWAKPVPVNGRALKHPKEDMFWIALAGPLSNLMLAVIGTIMFVFSAAIWGQSPTGGAVTAMLQYFVLINLLLCVFNLIPLHPLDGGKVIARFLPENLNRFLEEQQTYLQVILIGFYVAGGIRYLAIPVQWMRDGILNGVLSVASLIF